MSMGVDVVTCRQVPKVYEEAHLENGNRSELENSFSVQKRVDSAIQLLSLVNEYMVDESEHAYKVLPDFCF